MTLSPNPFKPVISLSGPYTPTLNPTEQPEYGSKTSACARGNKSFELWAWCSGLGRGFDGGLQGRTRAV